MVRFELNAVIDEEAKQKSFHLQISVPCKTQGAESYFCTIHSPQLFRIDQKIFGVDEKQAYDLAFEFVRSLLRDKRLVDSSGKEIIF